jgi:hypothetical protein
VILPLMHNIERSCPVTRCSILQAMSADFRTPLFPPLAIRVEIWQSLGRKRKERTHTFSDPGGYLKMQAVHQAYEDVIAVAARLLTRRETPASRGRTAAECIEVSGQSCRSIRDVSGTEHVIFRNPEAFVCC